MSCAGADSAALPPSNLLMMCPEMQALLASGLRGGRRRAADVADVVKGKFRVTRRDIVTEHFADEGHMSRGRRSKGAATWHYLGCAPGKRSRGSGRGRVMGGV